MTNGFGEVCARGALVPTRDRLPGRESQLWLARRSSTRVVVRRLDPDLFAVDGEWVGDDLAWLHGFLSRLSATGFPAPAPIRAFAGWSWVRCEGAWWDVVTYLPGEPVGWREAPSLTQVGQLMARYHRVSLGLTPDCQRPTAVALESFRSVGMPEHLARWVEELAADLERIGHRDAPRCVVHGDFTAHNVLATGTPPRVSGVIDFALAHIEDPLADLGFALWRTGRAYQDAVGMHPDRVADMVAGYHRERRLSPEAAEAIAIYVRGRGIQQAVKRFRRAGEEPHPFIAERVDWLERHHTELTRSIGAAIAAG